LASADTNIEVALARDLMAGTPGAFERFVEHFRSKIFKYASLICGQREDAEEVAQDTLMKVFANFDQLREPERVRAWVFRIARNGCLMKRRKSVFAPTEELSIEDFMPQAGQDGARRLEIADWSALPDQEALRGELRGVIMKAIEGLPEIYRGVILLRDVEELSTEETAEVLDVGQEVVKTRLHRARLAVRQKIDQYLKSSQPAGARES
jgi:RNA polymerase sigma-70 factor (ECF subfamily)